MKAGRRLGEYLMFQGTGLQREWHDNGKLKWKSGAFAASFPDATESGCATDLLSERFISSVTLSAPRNIARRRGIKSSAEISRQARKAHR